MTRNFVRILRLSRNIDRAKRTKIDRYNNFFIKMSLYRNYRYINYFY